MGSLAWIRWNHYAEFWSQLASWVAREGDSGPFTLRVRNSSDGALELEAQKADATPVSNLFCRISGAGHDTDVAMTQVGTSTYDGESVPLPRGKYTLVLMLKAGDTERVLLQRQVAIVGSPAVDSAELRLQPTNTLLLREIAQQTGGDFDAPVSKIVHHAGAMITTYRLIDSTLMPLAIFLLLGR